MAYHKIAVFVAEVHATAFAVAKHLTIGTLIFFHPTAVAIILEPVFPHVPKIVLVDVSLIVFSSNAGAC